VLYWWIYYPQTDGLAERFNATLMQSLSIYVSKNQKDWDMYIHSVLLNSVSSAFWAWKSSTFIDIKLLKALDVSTSINEYRQRIVESVERTFKKHSRKLNDTTINMPRNAFFIIGQKVWVFKPKTKKNLSKKLLHLWHGPYRIVELSPVHFFLRNEISSTRKQNETLQRSWLATKWTNQYKMILTD
jgi:hypothetical protein